MSARATGRLLVAAGVVLSAASVAAPLAAQEDVDDTVSVVMLSIDALRPTQLGAVDADGDPVAPNLRELRDAGTEWTQARSIMASETLPNHASMGTGQYAGSMGIPGNTGRLAPGDTAEAPVDLGVRGTREGVSTVRAIETQCADLRTVTAFSKDYVWRTFQDQTTGPFGSDPADDGADAATPEADEDFHQPTFNIPGSGHAPDLSIGQFLLPRLQEGRVDHLFVNFGDHDRVGHVDGTGADALGLDLRLAQRTALGQIDTIVGQLVDQLQASGEWERTVLLLVSDHSMVWRPLLPDPLTQDLAFAVDVDGALEAVEAANGFAPGEVFFTSLNGGAAFVYLVDPARPGADALLAEARAAIAALEGVDEALHRLPNPTDPGQDLASVHPDWHLEGTDRAGSIVVTAESPWALGTGTDNPLPGNHGHAVTRHTTAIVTGGWDGIVQQTITPSDPDAVDQVDDTAALPEQVEQVDWAPTIGWLLGVEDPGVADGGQPQWEGRVLREAFTRQPDPVCAAADGGQVDPAPTAPDGGADPGPDEPEPEPLPATGGGLAAGALLVLAGSGLRARDRRTRRGTGRR